MHSERIEINRLHVRVPGLGREEAQWLGGEVAQRLARELPGQEGLRDLGALHLRVRVAPGARADDLAGRIAEAIVRGISR